MAMAMAVTVDNELLELFTRYNEDLWPLHVVAYTAGIAAVALLFARRRDRADRVIAGLLAALWLWLGLVFQGLYATDVDVVLGTAYAVMFVLQACLLFWHGVVRGELVFRRGSGITGALGWAALGYAVVVYPLIGAGLGHGWPEAPLLGMAPCPTTILTLGLLLLAAPPLPARVLVVPFAWAVLAPPAAMARGVYEAPGGSSQGSSRSSSSWCATVVGGAGDRPRRTRRRSNHLSTTWMKAESGHEYLHPRSSFEQHAAQP